MSYLFPINPIDKSNEDKLSPVEKIGDDASGFSKEHNHQNQDENELEEKVSKLVNTNDLSKALETIGLDFKTKAKLLQIAKQSAATFLKKELLTVAKSILSISSTKEIEEDLDDDDLTLSEQLAKLVMKIAQEKPSKKSVRDKIGKTNPLEDKNAGFLVHYCKDILNQKIKNHKNNFNNIKKLNKNELNTLLKK